MNQDGNYTVSNCDNDVDNVKHRNSHKTFNKDDKITEKIKKIQKHDGDNVTKNVNEIQKQVDNNNTEIVKEKHDDDNVTEKIEEIQKIELGLKLMSHFARTVLFINTNVSTISEDHHLDVECYSLYNVKPCFIKNPPKTLDILFGVDKKFERVQTEGCRKNNDNNEESSIEQATTKKIDNRMLNIDLLNTYTLVTMLLLREENMDLNDTLFNKCVAKLKARLQLDRKLISEVVTTVDKDNDEYDKVFKIGLLNVYEAFLYRYVQLLKIYYQLFEKKDISSLDDDNNVMTLPHNDENHNNYNSDSDNDSTVLFPQYDDGDVSEDNENEDNDNDVPDTLQNKDPETHLIHQINILQNMDIADLYVMDNNIISFDIIDDDKLDQDEKDIIKTINEEKAQLI